jgi:phosphoesterase RecJ-like protein
MILERIADALVAIARQGGLIGIYPHVGADGDALGSALGLALPLREAGAQVRIFTDEPVSARLDFLPSLDLVQAYASISSDLWPADQALSVAVDCTEPQRVGCRMGLYLDAPLQASLDHHVSSGESGGLHWIDPQAAATGEIILDLVDLLEQRLEQPLMTQPAAMALITAIISDTGGFVYSNTSARSFAAAARLMAFEPDLRTITYRLFHETSQTRLRLTGRLFTDAQFLENGRLVYASVGQTMLKSMDADEKDLDGIVADLRNVAGVEVAMLFRELADGAIRVNIRSNDRFHAADFARAYGGGGHAKAAGMTVSHSNLAEVTGQVLADAARWLHGPD